MAEHLQIAHVKPFFKFACNTFSLLLLDFESVLVVWLFEELIEDWNLDTNLPMLPKLRLTIVPTFLKNFLTRLHPSTSWVNRNMATNTTRNFPNWKKVQILEQIKYNTILCFIRTQIVNAINWMMNYNIIVHVALTGFMFLVIMIVNG